MTAVRLFSATTKTPILMSNAARRTAAIARQMSSSSSEEVTWEARDGLRLLTLNRPKALNALNTSMIAAAKELIDSWESSPDCKAIVLQGTGRAFCAGGDVVSLVKMAQHADQRHGAIDFFRQEYDLDQKLAHLRKPAAAILDGITMGGGVGLSVHLPFRIVTERTVFSMPETTIGLFPDVGATFFLARMDGQLGAYLGLTSERLTGYAAYDAGIGTHFIPSGNLDFMRQRLVDLLREKPPSLDALDALFEENAADASFLREYREKQPPLHGAKRSAIDSCFRHARADDIIRDLRRIEQGSFFKRQNLEAWAKETADTIEKRSPTSVKVSLMAIRRAKALSIDSVFRSDLRLAATCCTPSIAGDFITGVTHQLINKERETRAAWQPSTLAEIRDSSIDRIWFHDPPPQDLRIPLLQRDQESRKESDDYVVYPHAGRGLPSERSIRQLVTGEAPKSGSYAITEEELLEKLRKQYNRASGKIGLAEKVHEVVDRMCVMSDVGELSWKD